MSKILIFSPHADDAEIAMAGTIAKLLNEKKKVKLITCIIPIENNMGKQDEYMNKNRLKEQEMSAKFLGCELTVLKINPYEFTFSRKYIQIFDKIIKVNKPNTIFCCWNHDTHQDHQYCQI